jgi:hypothetical protein
MSASKGGSRSERAGDVPLPKGSPSSGTVEEGHATNTDAGRTSGMAE